MYSIKDLNFKRCDKILFLLKDRFQLAVVLFFMLVALSCNTYIIRNPILSEFDSWQATLYQVRLGPDEICFNTGYNQKTCYFPKDNSIGFAWVQIKMKNNASVARELDFRDFILATQGKLDEPQFIDCDLICKSGWTHVVDPNDSIVRWLIFRYPRSLRPDVLVFNKTYSIPIHENAKK